MRRGKIESGRKYGYIQKSDKSKVVICIILIVLTMLNSLLITTDGFKHDIFLIRIFIFSWILELIVLYVWEKERGYEKHKKIFSAMALGICDELSIRMDISIEKIYNEVRVMIEKCAYSPNIVPERIYDAFIDHDVQRFVYLSLCNYVDDYYDEARSKELKSKLPSRINNSWQHPRDRFFSDVETDTFAKIMVIAVIAVILSFNGG